MRMFLFIACILTLSACDNIIESELQRREKKQEYYCDHYGHAMNKHYGREVCPPTPNG